MINKLRKTFHVMRESERRFVIFYKVGIILCPFTQTLIQPLSYVFLLFIQCLIYTHSCQVDGSCLLVEPLSDSLNSVTPLSLYCCNSCNVLTRSVAIISLYLNEVKLNS